MAVSGLEQRRVPLVISSCIWSPWGPGLVAPLQDEQDVGDGTQPTASQHKLRRSHSWGNYSTRAQLASRGLPVDSDEQSEPETPETPPTAAADSILAGRGKRKQRNRNLALKKAAAPQLQPAPVPRGAVRNGKNVGPVLLGSGHAGMESKQAVKLSEFGPGSAANSPVGMNATAKPITTLALRNLPFSLTQQDLFQALDASGFAGLYDFVYLPHKFKEHRNVGFAFINFLSEDVATRFTAEWQHTYRFTSKTMRKPVNICPAMVQGRQENERSAASHKMGRVKNSAFRPMMLDRDRKSVV